VSGLIRFGVSLDEALLKKFDVYIKENKYQSRSEALRDLIRKDLIKKEWTSGENVTGIINIVYTHGIRALMAKLTDIQHKNHHLIISTQHIHLTHDDCLEVIIAKGSSVRIINLAAELKSLKGVKYGDLSMAGSVKSSKNHKGERR